MIAEPLESDIGKAIEKGDVSGHHSPSEVESFFRERGWDILAARGVWAFGPTDTSPNILLDDTLSSEVHSSL